jgi:hypothetical protein
LTVAGELRIVPTQDIGELGPSQGQATVFPWKWYYGAQGLLVWAVLGLAMVIPKANRDRRVLLILIPAAVAVAAWSLFARALHMPSSQQYQFDWLVDSLVVAIAVLWLLAPGLGRLPVAGRFLCSLFLMCAVAVVGVVSSFASSSPEAVILPIFFGLFAMLLLLSLTAAVQQCKKRYGPFRFLLRLAAWIVIGAVALVYGYIVVVSLSSGTPLPRAQLFASFGLIGLGLGASLFLCTLPYMVLGLASPFYRDRMQACLGLPPRREQSDLPGSASMPL